MKKFIVLYHAPAEAVAAMGEPTPEQMKEGMKPWMEWAKKCGNKLVDLGTPLTNGQKVHPNGSSSNSTREVQGYSILDAESMEEAKSLLDGHPHLSWNDDCAIEIYESTPMPEM